MKSPSRPSPIQICRKEAYCNFKLQRTFRPSPDYRYRKILSQKNLSRKVLCHRISVLGQCRLLTTRQASKGPTMTLRQRIRDMVMAFSLLARVWACSPSYLQLSCVQCLARSAWRGPTDADIRFARDDDQRCAGKYSR